MLSVSTTSNRFPSGFLVAGIWAIGRRIGNGSFGEIYVGTHAETGKEIAMKFERCKSKHPQLLYEAKLLRRLQGGEGVAQLYHSGVVEIALQPASTSSLFTHSSGINDHGGLGGGDQLGPDRFKSPQNNHCQADQPLVESYNVMVTELLGPTLEDLFTVCDRKLHAHTVLHIMEEMLSRIEYLHSSLFIHRDIKPENFLIGRGEKSKTIFMIDFGLAKRYCDPRSGEHIPYREDKSLTGTARYASINAHLGIEQSRRDDLEAAGYVMLYLSRGGFLPWQGMKASKKQEKYKLIMEKKLGTPVEVLCQNQPREFAAYLRYCHALRFTDIPDYNHLRRLLASVRIHMKIANDMPLDWIVAASSRSDAAKRLSKLGFQIPHTQPPSHPVGNMQGTGTSCEEKEALARNQELPFASLFQRENCSKNTNSRSSRPRRRFRGSKCNRGSYTRNIGSVSLAEVEPIDTRFSASNHGGVYEQQGGRHTRHTSRTKRGAPTQGIEYDDCGSRIGNTQTLTNYAAAGELLSDRLAKTPCVSSIRRGSVESTLDIQRHLVNIVPAVKPDGNFLQEYKNLRLSQEAEPAYSQGQHVLFRRVGGTSAHRNNKGIDAMVQVNEKHKPLGIGGAQKQENSKCHTKNNLHNHHQTSKNSLTMADAVVSQSAKFSIQQPKNIHQNGVIVNVNSPQRHNSRSAIISTEDNNMFMNASCPTRSTNKLGNESTKCFPPVSRIRRQSRRSSNAV